MALLRRSLYLDALLAELSGLAFLAVPRFVVTTLLAQPSYPDYAWVRLLGVALIALGLLMVLVAHRIEELWWWSWAFVILEAGTGFVLVLHAAFGLPAGAAPWAWGVMAARSWAFAFGLLGGLARAGAERPVA
jgi:hypothetical protein